MNKYLGARFFLRLVLPCQKKVTNVFEHVRDTVYQLHIGNELVNTNSDHPFFVGGRCLRVKDLHVGDSVATYRNTKVAIGEIQVVYKRTVVHNFEVEDYHTYYVSEQQFLVHNNKCGVNGNDLKSDKAQHLYEIEDTHTQVNGSNEVVKTGISGGKETVAGGSYRAIRQANKWNRAAGTPGRYVSKIVSRVSGQPGGRQIATVLEKLNAQALRGIKNLTDPLKHVKP